MARLLILFVMAWSLSGAPALAGKDGKYAQFRSSYSYVINQVGHKSAKGKKAKALMASVRSGYKTMSRGAFYTLVAAKEPKLLALAN